jgi:sugar phosphate permease
MILGTFLYGPMDRIFGTRKWINVFGATISVVLVVTLAMAPPSGIWYAAALFAVIGMVLSNYPMIMAHGRAFLPPHLVGRGVTLMNLFSIGGAGLAQVITGPLYQGGGFVPVFLFYAGAQAIGLIIYLFAQDRTD